MKKSSLLLALSFSLTPIAAAIACSDVFVSDGGFHVQGRTMDFPINMGMKTILGFAGQKHTTDIVVDADKIPQNQRINWQTRYGYAGRAAFNTAKIIDGMNTTGFSMGILYLPNSQYPVYQPKDARPVISVYDVGSYLLSQAGSVQEAIGMLKGLQVVTAAIEAEPGYFIKDIPIHYVLRDKTGASAVIEFINGETVVYENATEILTNEPRYPWQTENAKFYDSLLVTNTTPNPNFVNRVYNYQAIYQSDFRHSESNLLGMPGDFSSPSRFVRARVILNNYMPPQTTAQALYQVDRLNESMNTPTFPKATTTLWATIKDLDNTILYYKDYGSYQADGSYAPMPLGSSYQAMDLRNIDLSATPKGVAQLTIQATPATNIKKIVSAGELPVFKGVD